MCQVNIALNSMGVSVAHPHWSEDKHYGMLRVDIKMKSGLTQDLYSLLECRLTLVPEIKCMNLNV